MEETKDFLADRWGLSMDGLLLHILDDSLRGPARSFSKLFAPIVTRLDSHYIVFDNQPWMGLSCDAREAWDNGENKLWAVFPECAQTSIQLWRPRTLSAYSEHFGEEYISFWAVKADSDPIAAAQEYSRTRWSRKTRDRHAWVSFDYFDSTCWEIYCAAPISPMLSLIEEYLRGKPWVKVTNSRSDSRKQAFSFAGLGHLVENDFQ